MNKIKILVIGCGNMGTSHALAYHELEAFEICGLVSRGKSNQSLNDKLGGKYSLYDDYKYALEISNPDAVCISTYPDTHEQYAIEALKKGCHVFLEKPISTTIEGTKKVINASIKANKKLVVGYILRHHPSWIKFIDIAKTLGKPLVMRMNLNQQSKEETWNTHKSLMKSMSPIVDCGVHYVDVMCQMTRSKPIRVNAIGARLTEEIAPNMYNYGQLQVTFEDGSVGWYEAGWGPMMSETAFFIKDVVGKNGCVSIVANEVTKDSNSDNINDHTKTQNLKVHYAELNQNNQFKKSDEIINLKDEPDHNELCKREQQYFYQSIVENIDLSDHLEDALNSLKIVLAADESFKSSKTVYF